MWTRDSNKDNIIGLKTVFVLGVTRKVARVSSFHIKRTDFYPLTLRDESRRGGPNLWGSAGTQWTKKKKDKWPMVVVYPTWGIRFRSEVYPWVTVSLTGSDHTPRPSPSTQTYLWVSFRPLLSREGRLINSYSKTPRKGLEKSIWEPILSSKVQQKEKQEQYRMHRWCVIGAT